MSNTSQPQNGVNITIGNSTTASTDPDYGQQSVTWFAVIVLVAAVTVNGICLTAFAVERRLHTVFNYYLINLTITDICYTAISMPSFIVQNFYGYWPASRNLCTFYLWADWTFSSSVGTTVLVIGADRVWALYWPIHYRHNHTRKVTLIVLAGMWLWLLASILPGIIANHLTADLQLCEVTMETQLKRGWGLFVNLANYIIPQFFIITSFVLVALKVARRPNNVTAGRPTGGRV